ncbi:MAG: glycosyl hydrolase [Chlamydiota bacterium]
MNLRMVVPTYVLVTSVAVCTTSSFAGVSLGVFLDGATDAQITGFFSATKQHAIVQYALLFDASSASHTELMSRVNSHNATPMCVWGTYPHTFNQIISGADDAYIRSVADAVKAFDKPVILALCAEFNLSSSPYYGDPAKYKQMWQHVHDIFTTRGATKAQWAFCPNYQGTPGTDYSAYYPGDAYVDWVGALGFDTNWGGGGGSAGLSFSSLFGPVLGDEASRYPHKPQIVMWFATAGSAAQKPGWIQISYGSMGSYPNLRAVVWYNKNDTQPGLNADYRVWDTSGVPSSVTTAYKNAISSSANFLTYLPPYADLIPGGGGGGKLDITPSPSTVARGANITINYAFTGITQRVDAYLGVVMIDGSLLVMDPSQNFQSNIVPVAANYDVSGNPSGGLTFIVPATIPTGAYTFEAVWVPAGAPATETNMDVEPVTVN